MTEKKRSKRSARSGAVKKRTYLKQSDVPELSLDDALRVPRAIFDNYAGQSTSPFNVAKALDVEPGGRQFRRICGSAVAYGLADGGAQASTISVTQLAKRILRPMEESDDIVARKEALLNPRVFGEFLAEYNGHTFPRPDIARNVLTEMGVPDEKADDVLTRIQESATSAGLLQDIKGKRYVQLEGLPLPQQETGQEGPAALAQEDAGLASLPVEGAVIPTSPKRPLVTEARRRRVFITHGKNKDLIPPIKKLLDYGELEPVVSVEKQSVSKPVPEKVMSEMRGCGAGIIHVDAERIVVDKNDKEHAILNPNVLIEIGAAMAFYGRRFILLVREGVQLPSNLQGLYEVRYTGNALDSDVTIRLLEAIKDIKNYALPEEDINRLPDDQET